MRRERQEARWLGNGRRDLGSPPKGCEERVRTTFGISNFVAGSAEDILLFKMLWVGFGKRGRGERNTLLVLSLVDSCMGLTGDGARNLGVWASALTS